MPRNVGVSVENAFNRGLVTEVTGMNSPENSVVDTLNFVYDRRGKAVKRRGFSLETGNVWTSLGQNGVVYNEYVWETLFDNSDKNFVVLQVGSAIRFFEAGGEGALSGSLKPFSVNLNNHKTSNFTNVQVRETNAAFATGRGYLLITHPFCETLKVEYSSETDSISVSRITIKIRDFKGQEDGLDIQTRPSALSKEHRYNLFNQGWYPTVTYYGGAKDNALNHWSLRRSDFPSNADAWWYFTVAWSVYEAMNLTTADDVSGIYGNTPAPKGHYILDAFRTNRSALSGIANLKEDTSGGLRPSVVAFYAGRAFYSGVGKSGYSSLVYFSQIIQDDDQFGDCYQVNDPTSREISDILDTDGGVIDIQDITTIVDLRVFGQTLYVFASNGVWAITGTDNTPFKATNYTVTKITSEPALSRQTIVEVSNTPIWWNHGGIYVLKTQDLGLTTDVSSLTTSTIQTFFEQIPQACRAKAKGSYNSESDLIYWIYSENELDPTNYTRLLVLDAVSLAFYPLSIPAAPYRIRGVVPVKFRRENNSQDAVILSDLDTVIVSGGSQVYVDLSEDAPDTGTIFKFVTTDGGQLTFSEIRGETYLDWGVSDYDNYFITGYRIRGELLRRGQTNYLSIFTDTIANSSGWVQPVWDYASSNISGRFGNPQQIYRGKDHYDYQSVRLKIRGTGRSLQFRFSGVQGAPLSIIGWAGYETSNTSP